MNDLEKRLRSLPRRGPSDNLRKRIFGAKPAAPADAALWFAHRIPVGWAAAMALTAGLLGLTAGRWLAPRPAGRSAQIPGSPSAVMVRIVEATTTRHMFDFSAREGHEAIRGEWEVRVNAGNGA